MPSPTSSSDDAGQPSAFDSAAAAVEVATAAGALPPSTSLQLYALFKQATAGDAPDSQPPVWDLSGRAKCAAWRRVAGMSAEDAKAAYAALARERLRGGGFDGGPPPPPSITTIAAMGPVFSALPMLDGGSAPPSALTLLGAAASDGDAAGVAAALAAGADAAVAAAGPDDGATPLHLAADAGSEECVSLLLAAGAPVNARDVEGGTPVSYAAAAGRQGVVDVLRRAGGVM